MEIEFKTAFHDIIGLKCSKVLGTSGVGSMISILFGDAYEKNLTLRGKPFSFWDSDITLSLEWAAWRVQVNSKVLCSSTSDNGVGSQLECGVQALEGRLVTRIAIRNQTWDVALWFSDDYQLAVFCDQVNERLKRDNYVLRHRGRSFIVASGGALRIEARR